MALAVLGTWSIGRSAPPGPSGRVVVAARVIPPGATITAADVRIVGADLPRATRRGTFRSLPDVLGRVALGPIGAGDIIGGSAVGSATADGARELSFAVDPAWAVGGDLVVGDRVDVLVTYGEGAASLTRAVLSRVTVTRLSRPDQGGLGSVAGQVITISIRDRTDVLGAANAVRAGSVTLVRATGASTTRLTGTYRPTAATIDPSADHD